MMRVQQWLLRWGIACLLLVVTGPFAAASTITQERVLRGVQHAAWTPRDGAPASIMAIEQAPDGALWLGSRQGLYRFDGLHFERITVVDEDRWSPADIYALHAMPNGDLWIGQFSNGITLLHGGRVTRYHEGLPKAGITQFHIDGSGTLWASSTQGLARFDGTRFHTVGLEMGLPVGQSVTCILDANGNLIVRTFTPGLFVLRRGASRFEHVEDTRSGYLPFAMDAKHRVWESTKDGPLLLPSDGHNEDTAKGWTYPSFPPDIRFDPNGWLWATERGFGIRRVHADTAADNTALISDAEVFTEKDGLTSNQVMCNFVDRDGDAWVGTERGLDRFHAAALTRIDAAIGAAYLGTQPAPDGGAWIVAFIGGAWLRTASGDIVLQKQLPSDMTRITAIATDEIGGLWLASASGIGHLTQSSWKKLPPPVDGPGKTVTAIASDHAGGFWAAVTGVGMAHWNGASWAEEPALSHVPATTIIHDGRELFVGTRDGNLFIVDGSHHVKKRALSLGGVSTLTLHAGKLWIGGDRGIGMLSDNHFLPIPLQSSPDLFRISGLVLEENDDLWLNTATGVARVSADQWHNVLQGHAHIAQAELYDAADGVEGLPLRTFLTPTATLLTSGELIFSTQLGLYAVNPRLAIKRNASSMPYVTALHADGEAVGDLTQLRPKIHTLEIAYGAACLRDIQRLKFRYRLIGYDRDWQQAASRREALYTDIPPGRYQFESESTFDGVHWSEPSAPFRFVVPPSFTQRTSVRIAAVALFVFALWIFLRWRIARILHVADLRLQERISERERIARDLHDTLLQSVQGLILRFGALIDNPTFDATVRSKMQQSLTLAEHVVTEGRDRVRDLRGANDDPERFEGSLIETGTLLSAGTTTHFEWTVAGDRRVIKPVLSDELILVAREAMHNAFQHAQAQCVALRLDYGKDECRLTIADDGVGLPKNKTSGERPGHWGIPGMKERAARLGCRITFTDNRPRGTCVTITSPAAVAYQVTSNKQRSVWSTRIWHLLNT